MEYEDYWIDYVLIGDTPREQQELGGEIDGVSPFIVPGLQSIFEHRSVGSSRSSTSFGFVNVDHLMSSTSIGFSCRGQEV
jgi:hypothetical protein